MNEVMKEGKWFLLLKRKCCSWHIKPFRGGRKTQVSSRASFRAPVQLEMVTLAHVAQSARARRC